MLQKLYYYRIVTCSHRITVLIVPYLKYLVLTAMIVFKLLVILLI